MDRTEEKELIIQIKDFKQQIRDSLKKNFLREREDRHKKGEIFFKGFWIPQNKIENIQKAFLKRGKIIFFEIHILIIIVFFFNALLWFILKKFLLP